MITNLMCHGFIIANNNKMCNIIMSNHVCTFQKKYTKYKNKYIQKGGNMDNILCECTNTSGEKYKMCVSIKNNTIFIYHDNEIVSYFIVSSAKSHYNLLNTIDCKKYKLKLDKLSSTSYKWKIFDDIDELCYEVNNYQEEIVHNINTNKKIVIFIRHCESVSNTGSEVENPTLTSVGFEQAEKLKTRLNKMQHFFNVDDEQSLAIVSPLQRTVLTAKPFITQLNILIVASFLTTEIVRQISSIGFETQDEMIAHYATILPDKTISCENMNYMEWTKTIWNDRTGIKSPDKSLDLIKHRISLFNEYLKNREEKIIYVFSHAAFIKLYMENALKITSASRINYGLGSKEEANLLTNANLFIVRHD